MRQIAAMRRHARGRSATGVMLERKGLIMNHKKPYQLDGRRVY